METFTSEDFPTMIDLLRQLKPGETLWDKEEKASVKGLHLRYRGRKTFYLYYRTKAGQQRRPALGELGEITLAEARRRARILLDQVAVGIDPKGQWDVTKAEMTVEDIFQKVLTAHWSQARFTESGWARDVKNLYKNHLKVPFGRSKLSDVTPMRVREWHRAYAFDKTYSGNRALTVLSKLFTVAEEQEWRPQHTNPCHLVKAHPEGKRKRFASEEEIRKIFPLLEKEAEHSPHGVAFIYLLMFSGSRPRAIERATWDQLREFKVGDEHFGELTFSGKSSGKTGQDERVILPPQAMKVISKLPRIRGETLTGIKLPRRLWNRIKKEAGCTDLWARDWRRTFATVGMSSDVKIGTIGELLNHSSNETTKIYAKLMDGARIRAVSTIADRLVEIMEKKVEPLVEITGKKDEAVETKDDEISDEELYTRMME